LAACLEASLRRKYSLDIKYQAFAARELARLGSIDGSYATIDLKSASDTLSNRLIHKLFPKQFLLFADMLRVKYVDMPDGRRVKLGMYSTMGNGYTFALQTAVFLSVVVAVYDVLGIPLIKPKMVLKKAHVPE
jgi:hypothetical protein